MSRVAVVTGGTRGIGAAISKALVAAGYKVAATYHGNDEAAAKFKAETGVNVYKWDVGNFDACAAGLKQVEADLGPVDVLVNNHAHWVPETFDPALVTDEAYGMRLADAATMDAHYAVIARASALMMGEYVRRYLARGVNWGRIINVSTDAAHAHFGAVSYAAAKHALESYSRSAAAELGKYGITVNIVAPGPVQTGWLGPDEETAIGAKTPLARVGRPEDIADVIIFLASGQARWLTGQLIYAGGGWRMHP